MYFTDDRAGYLSFLFPVLCCTGYIFKYLLYIIYNWIVCFDENGYLKRLNDKGQHLSETFFKYKIDMLYDEMEVSEWQK